jgi:hypothetical protein
LNERSLQNVFRMQLTQAIPTLRAFVRSVGVFELEDGRVFRAGIKGQCDIYAMARGGLHIELELKAEKGRLTKEQIAWRDFCIEWGVPWLLLQPARGELVEATMERWIGLVRELVSSKAAEAKRANVG